MSLKNLVELWHRHAQATLTSETYSISLPLEDAAKIDALAEMYPKRSKDQIISELVSAALADLEQSFPYIQGAKVISTDEMGDPIYEDVGPTPSFIELTKKHLTRHRTTKSN